MAGAAPLEVLLLTPGLAGLSVCQLMRGRSWPRSSVASGLQGRKLLPLRTRTRQAGAGVTFSILSQDRNNPMFLFAAGITVTNHPMNKTSASLSLDYLYVQGAGLREGGHHVAGEGASHCGLHGFDWEAVTWGVLVPCPVLCTVIVPHKVGELRVMMSLLSSSLQFARHRRGDCHLHHCGHVLCACQLCGVLGG